MDGRGFSFSSCTVVLSRQYLQDPHRFDLVAHTHLPGAPSPFMHPLQPPYLQVSSLSPQAFKADWWTGPSLTNPQSFYAAGWKNQIRRRVTLFLEGPGQVRAQPPDFALTAASLPRLMPSGHIRTRPEAQEAPNLQAMTASSLANRSRSGESRVLLGSVVAACQSK